jgi:predicted Zn finger-like uncharacterized protein
MANIRVTCPACKTELEVDAAFEGQEVECGNCLEVFTAKPPTPSGGKIPGTGSSRGRKRADDEERPARSSRSSRSSGGSRRSRRDDDEDDDYDDEDDYDYYSPPRRSGGGNGLAVTALILGIVSIPMMCCCGYFVIPISLAAIITGGIGMRNPEGKGMAITGLVLGIISLALVVVAVIGVVGLNVMNPNKFK